MKRSGFKRKELVRVPPAPPTKSTRHGVYTAAGGPNVSIPKGVEAKPGKRAPTAEEKAWMDDCVETGCIACWLDRVPHRPTAIHHIVEGGRRLGHKFSLPLCDPGHHQGGQSLGLVSRHPWKARFEERYGSERELLLLQQERVRTLRSSRAVTARG